MVTRVGAAQALPASVRGPFMDPGLRPALSGGTTPMLRIIRNAQIAIPENVAPPWGLAALAR